MLNAALTTVLVVAASATAAPAPPTDLAVGNVRDRAGRAIVAARVRALDARGHDVGDDRSDERGTFAITLRAPAATIEVTCPHCELARVRVSGDATSTIVVRRFDALESDVPTSRDLTALPYPRITDTLGLIPYLVPTGYGGVSDRGLGGALVLDNGAPAVNYASETSGVAAFPDRYVRELSFERAEEGYRYGAYGGGGTVGLDRLPDDASYASFDTGVQSSLDFEPKVGDFFPSAGISDDEGATTRRADLAYVTPFAGGVLRVGITGDDELVDETYGDVDRAGDAARVQYATASQRYRTFVDLSASGNQYRQGGGGYDESYFSADGRIEKPGPIALAFGSLLSRENADSAAGGHTLYGATSSVNLYANAHAGDDRSNVDLTVAGLEDGDATQLDPTISGRLALGTSGAFVRASYLESPEVFSYLTEYELSRDGTYPLFRQEVAQTAVGYDAGGRVRAEAIAYDARTRSVSGYEGNGIGGSIVWQIAPLLSLRAWSLRVTPYDPGPYAEHSPYPDTSRQVLWSTYDNDAGLRLDAIVHRTASTLPFVRRPAMTTIDGDALLPIAPHVAVAAGSTYDAFGRHYTFGVRAR